VQPQLFRVISNSIDATDPTKHVITASLYVPDKYDYIEKGWEIREQPIRQDIPTVVAAPRSITLNSTNVNGASTLIVSWRRPLTESGQINPFIDSYQVEWSRDQVTWESSRIITNNNTTYQNVTPGVYYGRVQSIDITGRTSEFIYSRAFTVQVNQTPPTPITTETQDFTNPGNSSNVFFY
jgi:hypothetical protein